MLALKCPYGPGRLVDVHPGGSDSGKDEVSVSNAIEVHTMSELFTDLLIIDHI